MYTCTDINKIEKHFTKASVSKGKDFILINIMFLYVIVIWTKQ